MTGEVNVPSHDERDRKPEGESGRVPRPRLVLVRGVEPRLRAFIADHRLSEIGGVVFTIDTVVSTLNIPS